MWDCVVEELDFRRVRRVHLIDFAVLVQNLVVESQIGVWAEVVAPVICYHHIFGVRVWEFAVVVCGSIPPPYINFVVKFVFFVFLTGFDILH